MAMTKGSWRWWAAKNDANHGSYIAEIALKHVEDASAEIYESILNGLVDTGQIELEGRTMGRVYEYVVVLEPTKEEQDMGELLELVVGPLLTVAKDEEAVKMIASREIPKDYAKKALDRCKVIVRPFRE